MPFCVCVMIIVRMIGIVNDTDRRSDNNSNENDNARMCARRCQGDAQTVG